VRLDAFVGGGCLMENKPTLLKWAAECMSKDVKNINTTVTEHAGASALDIFPFVWLLIRFRTHVPNQHHRCPSLWRRTTAC
jgi:hypothetical protein